MSEEPFWVYAALIVVIGGISEAAALTLAREGQTMSALLLTAGDVLLILRLAMVYLRNHRRRNP
jgi:hypothetical protein